MRKKFDIKYRPQIESGEYKVVTDCGESVEIVKWNCKGKCPILAVIDDGDTSDSCFFTEDGSSLNEKDWLYIETPESELTEFEQAVGVSIGSWNAKSEESKARVREVANKLLKLARKQLDSEYEEQIKAAYKAADEVQYQRGYEAGKAEVLKSVPQWHNIDGDMQSRHECYIGVETVIRAVNGISSVGMEVLRYGNRYLYISELAKLSKED